MIISALNRKLLRDLWAIRGQATAICMVMSAGVAMFVMSLSTLRSLRETRDTYYDRSRFAHVFANLKSAPLSVAARIAELPGVAQVQPRIVKNVTLNVPGLNEPAVGRLISVGHRSDPKLNALHLRRGRWLDARRSGEVLLGESFAAAHGFQPGDSLEAIINGRLQRLEIVGIVLSPEYLIQIQAGSLLPDDLRFGVFWMEYDHLAAAFNMEGAFNDVTLSLMRGASVPEVLRGLDRLTADYGAVGAYDRGDQLSHTYISDEIRQLSTMGLVAPSIFLGVAAFLLNIVLSRQINTQREQIAALKAFGYSRREIGGHYLKFVLVLVLVGVTAGSLLGAWMGHGMTRMYTQFYRFPVFTYRCEAWVLVSALLITTGASLSGTVTAVLRAVRLAPAEAMRPEPPRRFHPTLVEQLGLGGLLSPVGRMILRQLERRPLKSLMSCLGIALAVSVLVLGSYMEDALDYIIDYQFRLTQRQDVMVTFVEAAPPPTIHEVAQLPGVLDCEPFRSVATRFRFRHHSRRVGIMGLPRHSRLFRLLDDQEVEVTLPAEGLLLSSKLAELLEVRVGDVVRIEVLEEKRPVRDVLVAGLIKEFGGTNAYMSLTALHGMLREDARLSGAMLTVDARQANALYGTLKTTPQVAAVNVKTAALKSFRETIMENLLRMRTYNIIFSCIIAFGVVYNSARISLAERSRELATLRVIGFTRTEVSAVLLGELAALTAAAIPCGLLLGYLFCAWMSLGLDTEIYRIPLVVDRSTYGFAAVVVVLATIGSGLIVRRRVDHLDLVAVLKTKE